MFNPDSLRLYGALAGLFALLGLVVTVDYWKHEADRVPALNARIGPLTADANALKTTLARQIQESDLATQQYLDEIHRQQDVGNARDDATVGLRCHATTVYLPAPAAGPYSPTPSPATARLFSSGTGQDAAPDVDVDTRRLYWLADEADRVSAQLRAVLALEEAANGPGAR